MKFLKSLNTHLVGLLSIPITLAGILSMPNVTPAVVALCSHPSLTVVISSAVTIVGAAGLYFGRPTTVTSTEPTK